MTPGSLARVKKFNVENRRAVSQGGQFVSRSAARREGALLRPHQLFGGEPAYPLQVATFDLSPIDEGRQRIAHVLQDVGAAQLVLTGEPVDLDLGHRGAVGKIMEGAPVRFLFVIVNIGRSVVARREERHPREVGFDTNSPNDIERDPAPGEGARPSMGTMSPRGKTRPSANTTSLASTENAVAATCGEPIAKGDTGRANGGAVEVGAARAAVAEVFGTLSVRVGIMRTDASGTPSASAAIWRILVCSPCPISVPPWLTCTLPSL